MALNSRLPNNPPNSSVVTLTTYATTATAADDTVTVASNTKLQTGDEIVIVLTGGTANNVTSGGTYYVVRIGATSIKLATTRANAIASPAVVVDIDGDAGGGTIYPVYSVGDTTKTYDLGLPSAGFIHVHTGGTLQVRGRDSHLGGSTEWCKIKFADGGTWSGDVGAIHSYPGTGNTVASDISIWY